MTFFFVNISDVCLIFLISRRMFPGHVPIGDVTRTMAWPGPRSVVGSHTTGCPDPRLIHTWGSYDLLTSDLTSVTCHPAGTHSCQSMLWSQPGCQSRSLNPPLDQTVQCEPGGWSHLPGLARMLTEQYNIFLLAALISHWTLSRPMLNGIHVKTNSFLIANETTCQVGVLATALWRPSFLL